jgi:pyruvate,water dikinase
MGPNRKGEPMSKYVIGLAEVDQTQVARVGDKGAHLGELARIEGIRVPSGFCITTEAFGRVMAVLPEIQSQLDQLSRLRLEDREVIRTLSAEIRSALERITIPGDVLQSIKQALARLGEHAPYAVRSSATAEDLPTASFAGQHDTYLNVTRAAAILQHVSLCWASLFTDRAVTYRVRNGFDSRKVKMAVVVQQMVLADGAGILFTTDPVTFNRKVSSVEATFGLGEALVSGLVNADVYKVRNGKVVAKTIATKRLEICASPDGGTQEEALGAERQKQPVLTDALVMRLAELGRRIEAHFGCPQDIEWCLVDDVFQIVQSRPITTLFPIPVTGDEENHVYLSVGHQQMMTDAMKPLGLSFWKLTSPAPMHEAGGRLFVDATKRLASPASRAGLLELVGRSDPLTGDALETLLERDDFIPSLSNEALAGPLSGGPPASIEIDPGVVEELIENSKVSIVSLKQTIRTKSGASLFDFILADLQELKRTLFDPRSHQVIMAGMEATWWLNDHLEAWLGEKNVADTLTQSVSHNVTSEMGLALLDVADMIRPYPDVVRFLQDVKERDQDLLDGLGSLSGGDQARDAIRGFLDIYGMRCVGEIDITRPRWTEQPAALVPVILSNIRNFEPGAADRLFGQGRRDALDKEEEVLERLHALPGGAQKADETKRRIACVRAFTGYREYPKFGMVSRYFVYKQALLEEAERLMHGGVLQEAEDIYYLSFEELQDVVRTKQVDQQFIDKRKDAFCSYQALTPPRVLTSDGEVIAGTYRRDDLPAGALIGLPVSSGVVEGRARVIHDIAEAELEADDILVTAYTDPSWTPLFVAIKGLVTEVGGLMTHGAVIAREYGLPAVVGVEQASRLIQDGQRIRVHGTDGYVEIL